MPANAQNSIGWLALQIAERQRQNDLAQQNQINQERREDNRAAGAQAVGLVKAQLDAQDLAENRKLQLAAMLHKATLTGQNKKELQDDQQAFKQPLQDSVVAKNNAQAGLSTRKTSDVGEDNARADEQQKIVVQHYMDQAEQARDADLTKRRGQDLAFGGRVLSAVDPVTGRRLYFPDQAGGMIPNLTSTLGLTSTPEPATDEVSLTKPEYNAAVKNLSFNKEDVAKLRDIVAALYDPKLANPEDFGVTGDKISFHGVSPNTLGDLFGTKGSKRRAALGQRINAPINDILRRYGAALTNTELGRGIGEAGLQQALDGSFSPFATPLPIVQSSFKYLLDQAERDLATNQQEVQTRTRKLEPTPKLTQSNEAYTKDLADKARAKALENPDKLMQKLMAQGMSEDEAFEKVRQERGD